MKLRFTKNLSYPPYCEAPKPVFHLSFFYFFFFWRLCQFCFIVADIDECSRGSHGCHHNCRNVPGSYFCSCRRGFRLSNDLKTCVGMERFHYSLILKKQKENQQSPLALQNEIGITS